MKTRLVLVFPVALSLIACGPGGLSAASSSAQPASPSAVAPHTAVSTSAGSIGPPEGPPVAAPGQMVFDLAAINAASGIVCAILARARTGRSQHVTVSALEVMAGQNTPRPTDGSADRRLPGEYNLSMAPSGTYLMMVPNRAPLVSLAESLRRQNSGNRPSIRGARQRQCLAWFARDRSLNGILSHPATYFAHYCSILVRGGCSRTAHQSLVTIRADNTHRLTDQPGRIFTMENGVDAAADEISEHNHATIRAAQVLPGMQSGTIVDADSGLVIVRLPLSLLV